MSKWSEQTMIAINAMTEEIKGKAFDPNWFLLRQRLEVVDLLIITLKEALEQTNCDGDLCAYRWHESARQVLARLEDK